MRESWTVSLGQPAPLVVAAGSWAGTAFFIVRWVYDNGLTKDLDLGPLSMRSH